jgi:hypothetical protein
MANRLDQMSPWERPRKARPTPRLGSVDVGADYTPAQLEFMLAMDRYKRRNNRPFPLWSEVLGVIESLGYARICPRCGQAVDKGDVKHG